LKAQVKKEYQVFKLLAIAGLLAAATHTFQSQTPSETVAQIQKGRAEMQKTVEAAVPHVTAVLDKVVMPAVNDFKRDSVAALQTTAAKPQPAVAVVKADAAYDWHDHTTLKNCVIKANGNEECK
jgi:hypothetical protein